MVLAPNRGYTCAERPIILNQIHQLDGFTYSPWSGPLEQRPTGFRSLARGRVVVARRASAWLRPQTAHHFQFVPLPDPRPT